MHRRRFLELKDRPRKTSAFLLIFITDFAALVFFYWLSRHIVWSVYAVIYLLAEIMCFMHLNFTAFSYAQMRFHRPQPPLKNYNPSVDVFITCCDEDISVIEQTVRAAVEIEYHNKKIYILDDGKSLAVRSLSDKLNCAYITREDRRFTKAGNLNNALNYSNGEFILVLDADQVARKDTIRRLIGYFVRTEIAFVQSPQSFITPQGDPYNSQDAIFNKSVELSKDAQNTVISCGSGVIYRRRAIEIIGGFSTWNLVEDLHTSYRLQQEGFVGIFYNYVLTKGIAPPTYAAVARQRHKWATDTLRIFFWDNPFSKKGLNLGQKINYFNLGLLYIFSGFCMPIYFILPVWSLFTNTYMVLSPAANYLLFRLPYFALTLIMNNLIFRSGDLAKVYQTWNFFFPIFIQGIIDALRNKHLKIRVAVTPKARLNEEKARPWYATANTQLVILSLYITSLLYAFLTYGINKEIFFVNAIWIVWGSFILLPLAIVVILREQCGYVLSHMFYTFVNRVVAGALSIIVMALLLFYIVPESVAKGRLFISRAEKRTTAFIKTEVTPVLEVAKENIKRMSYYAFIPMFSMFWQDTDYRRINAGAEFRISQADKAETWSIKYYFSHLRNKSSDTLNGNSFRIGHQGSINDKLSALLEVGMNSYTHSVAETCVGGGKLIYKHRRGNAALEFSRFDIIDTTDIFVPRYYTLVTNLAAVRHQIVTNDFKLEAYQSLVDKLAVYGNVVYGLYTDENIKKNLYLSTIYSLSPTFDLKYGFAFIDVRNPSPYYYTHNNSKIHQVSAEFTRQINDRLSFNTEEVLSYDIRKGIGASTFFGLKYHVRKNSHLTLSCLYSYAKDNGVNSNTNSLNFNAAMGFEF